MDPTLLAFKKFPIFTVTNNPTTNILCIDGLLFCTGSLGQSPRSGTLNHQTVTHWLIWGSPVKLLSKSFTRTNRATENVQEFIFASPTTVFIDFFFQVQYLKIEASLWLHIFSSSWDRPISTHLPARLLPNCLFIFFLPFIYYVSTWICSLHKRHINTWSYWLQICSPLWLHSVFTWDYFRYSSPMITPSPGKSSVVQGVHKYYILFSSSFSTVGLYCVGLYCCSLLFNHMEFGYILSGATLNKYFANFKPAMSTTLLNNPVQIDLSDWFVICPFIHTH